LPKAIAETAPVPDPIQIFVLHKHRIVFGVRNLLEFRLGTLLQNKRFKYSCVLAGAIVRFATAWSTAASTATARASMALRSLRGA
jgi:hypothetical protein